MPLINTYVDVSSEAGGLNFGLSFHYIPTLCLAPAKALVRLPICTDVPEPYLVAEAVITNISRTSSIFNIKEHLLARLTLSLYIGNTISFSFDTLIYFTTRSNEPRHVRDCSFIKFCMVEADSIALR